jgi:hypothetical protein
MDCRHRQQQQMLLAAAAVRQLLGWVVTSVMT